MIDQKQARAFIQSNGIDELDGATLDEVSRELLEQSLGEPSAERVAIMRDLASRLSGEAREVVRVVLNAPEEMVEYLWGMQEKQVTKITQHDLRQYLNWFYRWPLARIEGVFVELRDFVKNF